jgi:hypothetical protein
MSLDAAIVAAVVEALQTPEARDALRRAVERPAAKEPEDDDRAYTVAQVAELSGYTPATILERISARDLLAYKAKGCREWRIRRPDYRAWLINRTDGDEKPGGEMDPDEVAMKMLSTGRMT